MDNVENNDKKMNEAQESLKEDFGEEGLETLMTGVDAIIELSEKFRMPYDQVVKKMKEDDDAGLIRKVGDTYIAVEKVEETNED